MPKNGPLFTRFTLRHFSTLRLSLNQSRPVSIHPQIFQLNRRIQITTCSTIRLRKYIRSCSTQSNNTDLALMVPPGFKTAVYCAGGALTSMCCATVGIKLLWGFVAGIAVKTIFAPMERLITAKQTLHSETGYLELYRRIRETEGFFGLWKSNTVNVYRAAVQKGCLYAFQDYFYTCLILLALNGYVFGSNADVSAESESMEVSHTTEAVMMKQQHDQQHQQDPSPHTHHHNSFISTESGMDESQKSRSKYALAGLMAGAVGTIATYPLEVVKTAKQAHLGLNDASKLQIWYSMFSVRGVSGIWAGMLPSLIGGSIYYAIKFGMFAEVGEFLERHLTPDDTTDTDDGSGDGNDHTILRNVERFSAGSMAGFIGNVICYPNNAVRKKLMVDNVMHSLSKFNHGNIAIISHSKPQRYIPTVMSIYTKKGIIKGFYGGFGLNLIRNPLNTGLQFVFYHQCADLYRAYKAN